MEEGGVREEAMHGCSIGSGQTEPDRRDVGTAAGGTSSRPRRCTSATAILGCSMRHHEADRRTGTPLSACQTGAGVGGGFGEVRVAEREQADSLSMLLTTKWKSRCFGELHSSTLLFINTWCSCLDVPQTASHLGSRLPVEATERYELFIELRRLKLARSFVTAVCLGAASDPRVNINMAFLGQQLHY
ncbi:unnamed protein product [Pleuronectes platessa]|uniref:Uncharacterized protein n=1 Tax=Pleuronectes platessa TaxID=8262 RepID=A0A9N7YKJ8_PLEPL|nr:unnamed protein product [Pleuronectes platessa]